MKKNICTTLFSTVQHTREESQYTHLQHPYIESDEDILGHFLFYKADIETKIYTVFYGIHGRNLSN